MGKHRVRLWVCCAGVLLVAGGIVSILVVAPSSLRILERERPAQTAQVEANRGASVASRSPDSPLIPAATTASCNGFELWMTLQAGQVVHGCLGPAQITQLGTSWTYAFPSDTKWSLEIKTLENSVRSVSVASPYGDFVCRGDQCRAVSIQGPNQNGEKRIVLASAPVYTPETSPTPDMKAAARLRGELNTPAAAPICGGDALQVLYDDGDGRNFCATTINTNMSVPGQRTYTFRTLDGDTLKVRVNSDGAVMEMLYDNGLYRCKATACAGVQINIGAGPTDVRGFQFAATTLLRTTADAPSPQTVAFYGRVTVPYIEF